MRTHGRSAYAIGCRCDICIDSAREHSRQYYEKNREKLIKYASNYNRKRRYGVDSELYQEILKSQDYCCAICGRESERSLNIDHDHETGVVRGLLCNSCNSFVVVEYEKHKNRIEKHMNQNWGKIGEFIE